MEELDGLSSHHTIQIFKNLLGLVVRRVNNDIHYTNGYPVDGAVRFVDTYPLDSDL